MMAAANKQQEAKMKTAEIEKEHVGTFLPTAKDVIEGVNIILTVVSLQLINYLC